MNEIGTIPTGSSPSITVANSGSSFVPFGMVGLSYCQGLPNYPNVGNCAAAYPATQGAAMFNVGNLTPAKANYSVSTSGTLMFSSADGGLPVTYGYAYYDTTGTQTYYYGVAQIDANGGESTVSASKMTSTSNSSLSSTTHRNRITWPSLNGTGYAVYRGTSSSNMALIAKVDDIRVWEPRQSYYTGETIVPLAAAYNGEMFTALNDGYSGCTTPAWTSTKGSQVTETLTGCGEPIMPVTWLDMGAAMVTFDDLGTYTNWCTSTPNILELNIDCTAPNSALADAFVGTVYSVVGGTVTLTAAPTTSASSATVVHDDTVALNAALLAQAGNLNVTPAIYLQEGLYRISSALVMPTGNTSAYSIFSYSPQATWNVNAVYGAPTWQRTIGTTYTTPGGGSVIQASDAMPSLFTMGNGAPTISNISIIGYGVGQQSCLDGQNRSSGSRNTTYQYTTFTHLGIYNCYNGFRLGMQWSQLYSPIFAGNYFALSWPTSGNGTWDDNQIEIYSPQFQNNHLAVLFRDEGANTTIKGGSYEFNNNVYRGSPRTLSLEQFYFEVPSTSDLLITKGPIDLLYCQQCTWTNLQIGSLQNLSGPLTNSPAMIIRYANYNTFINYSFSEGAIYLCPVTSATAADVQCEGNVILSATAQGSFFNALVLGAKAQNTLFNHTNTLGGFVIDNSSPASTTIVTPGVGFTINGNSSVTCSGTPSASYAVTNGIVTHC